MITVSVTLNKHSLTGEWCFDIYIMPQIERTRTKSLPRSFHCLSLNYRKHKRPSKINTKKFFKLWAAIKRANKMVLSILSRLIWSPKESSGSHWVSKRSSQGNGKPQQKNSYFVLLLEIMISCRAHEKPPSFYL